MKNLKEGQQYEFRVRAITAAGPGKPSDATKPITAKFRFVKPFITGDKFKKIFIKKGEQIKYVISFGGEPEPEVKWEKDGAAITPKGDRITIEKSKNSTTLTVNKSVRSDSGKYKLILTNSSGTVESIGEVIVLDKPSEPKGPLEVTDSTETGCKLIWQKPDDDGGVPIKQYKIEKLDTKSGKWSLVKTISAEKTEFTVTDLVTGPEYKFRVSAINDEGESDSLTTETWTITNKKAKVVEYSGDHVEGGEVEKFSFENRGFHGDAQSTSKTTVTVTTSQNQKQEGNRTIIETRTVKRIVTNTTTEEEYEESEEEGEEEFEIPPALTKK